MCHKLMWFIHLRAQGLRKGNEHTTYTPPGVWHTTLYHFTMLCARPLSSIILYTTKVLKIYYFKRMPASEYTARHNNFMAICLRKVYNLQPVMSWSPVDKTS